MSNVMTTGRFPNLLTVGLTGGIAEGKSTVAGMLQDEGCLHIDADQIARDLVKPGLPALEEIQRHFGDAVIGADGCLDRGALAGIIFSDPLERGVLNGILHPKIVAGERQQLADISSEIDRGIVITEAALMVEVGTWRRFDRVVVVWCRSDLQRTRLQARDGFDDAEIDRRLGAQISRDERLRVADYDIDTSASLDEVREAVGRVFARLREDLDARCRGEELPVRRSGGDLPPG